MHVMILGAAGMLGRKLAERIAADGGLGGASVRHLTMADVIAPRTPHGFVGTTDCTAVDLTVPGAASPACSPHGRTSSITSRPSCRARRRPTLKRAIASTSTGCAICSRRSAHEQQGNAVGGREWSSPPRLRCSAGDMPDVIGDDYFLTPQTSYGTQKAMCELLLADYARRGFIQGIGLRLPTVCVRPGKPNLAASGFFSGIIREPLAGLPAVLPVSEDVRHWMASPRARRSGSSCMRRAWIRRCWRGRTSLTMPGSLGDGRRADRGPGACRGTAGDAALIRRER